MSVHLRRSCWLAFSLLLPRLALGMERLWLPPGVEGIQKLLATQEGPGMRQALSILPASDIAVAGAPAGSLDLAQLLDRHWKTSLTLTLGGKTAYLSGSFDRNQDAYVSVLMDGWERPLFFNLKGLMDAPGVVQAGGVQYQVTLSANALKPMKSKIVFENAADENDIHEPTVKQLLEATTAVGEPLQVAGQTYKVFYFRSVKLGPGGTEPDPKALTFAFILHNGDDFDVFLIPAELVPSDRIAVFKMKDDRRIGLKISGNRLDIFNLNN